MSAFTTNVLFILCFLTTNSIESDESETQKCSTKRQMEVLPGRGWDNLRNKDLGQVLKLSYEKCKTTEDGLYLLPDHVSTIAIKESKLDLTSELIEHYSAYTSITSKSFKVEASGSFLGIVSVYGSFSNDYQTCKQRQVDDKSMTTRIQVRNTMYLIIAEPSAEVDPSLKAVIMDALHDVEANNTDRAQLSMELIVRDYGTHYLTQIEAGAILAEEDFISSEFVKNYKGKKSDITAAAGANYLSKFSFGTSDNTQLTQEYKSHITSSHIRAYGGSTVEPNITVRQWSVQITNNLVATDRSGESLSYILTPQKFPDVSLYTLGQLRLLLDGAINDYYSFNTHVGCMDEDSTHFDFNANVNDDDSCKSKYNNYTFGGVFQTCTVLSEYDGGICDRYKQANPLTGSMSCPTGYTSIPLHTGTQTNVQQCSPACRKWSLKWILGCHEYCTVSVKYEAFWCVALENVPLDSGFMFGGLYSPITVNPLTKSQTCPTTYVPLLIGENLKVCVSNAYEAGKHNSIPFGGLFSCSQGNVLVHDDIDKGKIYRLPDDPYPHRCPGGYSQHMAIIDNYCEINYCVKANALKGQLPVVRPPFHDPAALYVGYSLPLKLSISETGLNSSLDGGSIAGIVIGCIVVLVSFVVGGVMLRRRRRRNNAHDEASDRELIIPEGSRYGTTNDTVIPVSPEV